MCSLSSIILYIGQSASILGRLFGCICTIMFWHLVIIWLYYQGFRVGSSRTLSVCFAVSLFYIPGLHLKFRLPSNPHISDWDLISHDPFIHDPLLMNTTDPFLIFTFPFSITSQVTFTTIHFSTTFTEIQTNTDFKKGCQL
jgi:hypothetical protein